MNGMVLNMDDRMMTDPKKKQILKTVWERMRKKDLKLYIAKEWERYDEKRER